MKKKFKRYFQTYMEEHVERVDHEIYLCVLFLMIFGCIMVSSASDMSLSKAQIVYCGLGLFVMLAAQRINYLYLKKLAVLAYVASFVMFVLLLVPGLGQASDGGAVRWLKIGPISVQVAEVAKLGLLAFTAWFLSKNWRRRDQPGTVLKLWAAAGMLAGEALLISSNLSSAIILLLIVFLMTLVYTDAPKLHGAVIVIACAAVLILVYVLKTNMPTQEELNTWPYMLRRVVVWLDPERYIEDSGYQVMLGLYGIGSGGFWGKGLGNGVNKYALPEAQNDIIIAVIGEELGVFGILLLTALYVYLLYLMLKVALNTKEIFGKVLVSGVFVHIAMQVLMNIAVATNCMPNTGISLPFISYGGSSVLFLSMEIGIVISVFRFETMREYKKMLRRKREEETLPPRRKQIS